MKHMKLKKLSALMLAVVVLLASSPAVFAFGDYTHYSHCPGTKSGRLAEMQQLASNLATYEDPLIAQLEAERDAWFASNSGPFPKEQDLTILRQNREDIFNDIVFLLQVCKYDSSGNLRPQS